MLATPRYVSEGPDLACQMGEPASSDEQLTMHRLEEGPPTVRIEARPSTQSFQPTGTFKFKIRLTRTTDS